MELGTHQATRIAGDSDWQSYRHIRRQSVTKSALSTAELAPHLDPARKAVSGSPGDCRMVPTAVRSALEFISDMAQLAMPSLFMAELEDECTITRTLCHGVAGSLRLCSHDPAHSAATQTATNTNDTTNKSNATNKTHNVAAQTDSEPGNVFGFEFSASKPCACLCGCCTNRSCFSSAAATVRNWRASALLFKGAGARARAPPAVSRALIEETIRLAGASPGSGPAVDDTEETWPDDQPPAYGVQGYQQNSLDEMDSNATKTSSGPVSSNSSTADGVALVSADKLLAVNQHLLRRIRKLELTNQIVREAYAEVSEILDGERQYAATQLRALKRKHDEDLAELANAYQERASQGRSSSAQSFTSDNESDSDYGFRPGFTTTNSTATITAAAGVSASCSSSPLMASAAQASPLLPPAIPRSVSDTAFRPLSESRDPCDLSIEFLTTEGTDGWDSDDSDGAFSDASDHDDDHNDDAGLAFASQLARHMHAADEYSSGSESDTESDSDDAASVFSDDNGGLAADDDDDSAPVNTLRLHISAADYATVDPVRAVISRYYPQPGRLSLAADIDDVASDGHSDAQGRAEASRPSIPVAHDAAAFLSPPRAEKSAEELELERNARLPADQRIAKFIHRAASHLQQGARSGLSLGFMLHNLEIQ
ncbi:hypothetical protein IWW51_004099, partial [Coemansia sp. RSA 2702]